MSKMKMSEAMRKGAKKSYQAFHTLYKSGCHQSHPYACAIGAMAIGFGFKKCDIIDRDYSDIDSRLGTKVEHPINGSLLRIEDIIISLNDTHQWNRGRIARWLEKIGF